MSLTAGRESRVPQKRCTPNAFVAAKTSDRVAFALFPVANCVNRNVDSLRKHRGHRLIIAQVELNFQIDNDKTDVYRDGLVPQDASIPS